MVPCPNSVLFASTTVSCAGRPATRYRAAREALPRVPTAFQGSKCVRGELKRRKYQVKALYQIRANALLGRGRTWRLQDIVLLPGLCARINHHFIAPPPALPTRLHYYCTTIAQYTTPLRPSLCMPYIIRILAMAISCKGQGGTPAPVGVRFDPG